MMVPSDRELMALLLLKQLVRSGNPDMDVFLRWVHDRLQNVHGEHELLDYMHALRRYSEGIKEIKEYLL